VRLTQVQSDGILQIRIRRKSARGYLPQSGRPRSSSNESYQREQGPVHGAPWSIQHHTLPIFVMKGESKLRVASSRFLKRGLYYLISIFLPRTYLSRTAVSDGINVFDRARS